MSLRTLLLPLLLVACTSRPYEYGASDTTTTQTTTTSITTLPQSSPSTSTAPIFSSTTATGADDPTTGSNFIITPDVLVADLECDQWTQDCPEGQKCMPYSGDGDNSWETLKCVDIVPYPGGLHDRCTAGPISTGEDTCDKGLMCWDVIDGVGQCVGQCIGSPDAPDCADPLASCIISGDGALTICLPSCDPLAQDCPGDDLCIPNPVDPDGWLCVLDAGEEGTVFSPCEYVNACDSGLLCVDPAGATECDPMALGCCLPLCDTTLPNTCPGQAQECLPWYEPGMAPPGYENVGLCALPMP